MRFIARKLSTTSYVNVMSQYRPCGRAAEVKGLEAQLSAEEYKLAIREAREEGITRLDQPHRRLLFR